MSILSESVSVIANEGVRSFLNKAREYSKRELLKIYLRFSPPLPKATTVVNVDGISATFSISSPITVERTNHLMGEKPVISNVLSNIQPDDVFYDIGANIGLYSCLVSEVSSGIKTVAFEPSPSNVIALSQNISNNDSNVTIAPVALSDSTGLAGFELEGDDPGVGTHSISKKSESQIRVGVFSGEMLVSQGDIPMPDVVKIDVEGAEMSVLRGFEGYLEEIRCIYCEIHGQESKQVKNYLRGKGFNIEVLLTRESEQFVRAFRDN